jgi:hypothetical protein
MRRWVLASVLAATASALTGCGTTLVRVSERFSLDAPWEGYQRVVVRTANGHVELFSGEGDEIRISGEKRAGGLTLGEAYDNLDQLRIVAAPDESDPTTFVIKYDFPETLRYKQLGASFDIRVPEPCTADITTGNGHIHVRGLKERALLRTCNGRIIIEDVDGHIDAETSNGRIIAESVGGECRLRTSNGRVEVREARGNVWVNTSNGAIWAQATPPPEGEVVLHTSNGPIHADLPANLRGTLTLHTSNGRVSTELHDVTLNDPRWSNHSFEAKMNGGGNGKIVARTSNGSITLNCR